MKPKKTAAKKLLLKKETISNLESQQMELLKGGMTYSDPRSCTTVRIDCSIYFTVEYTCVDGCPPCYPDLDIE